MDPNYYRKALGRHLTIGDDGAKKIIIDALTDINALANDYDLEESKRGKARLPETPRPF